MSTCCATIENNYFYNSSDGGYATGGVPCTIGVSGQTITGLRFNNNTCNAPKTGNSDIVITGTINGLTAIGNYMEGNCPATGGPDITPMVNIGGSVNGLFWGGGDAQTECVSGSTAKPIFTSTATQPYFIGPMGTGNTSVFMSDAAAYPYPLIIPATAFGSSGVYMPNYGTSHMNQVTVATGGGGNLPIVIGKITTLKSNTGNTGSQTYLTGSAITIPGGTMGANSILRITAAFARTSGSGNCTGELYAATSAGTLTSNLSQMAASSASATTVVYLTAQNSTTAQSTNYITVQSGNVASNNYTALSLNTANVFYINAAQQNTVSGDNCSLINEIVELIP